MSKQQEALRLALEALEEIHPGNMTPMAEGNWNKAITAIRKALAQAPTEQEQPAQVAEPRKAQSAVKQQEPVAFLANGTRFKISYDSRQSGGQIHGIPPELGGRWVAFVAADDDCHLKLTSPPASKPWEGLTDEEKTEIRRETYALPLLLMEAIEAKLKEKNT